MATLESFQSSRLDYEEEKLELETELLFAKGKKDIERCNILLKRLEKLRTLICNTPKILNDLDAEFESQTGITKKDFTFLILATTLQCLRQYCITDFKERLNDKVAANKTPGHNKESVNARKAGWYYASIDEIISSPVPFDASTKSERLGKIALGLGGSGHRTRALGHDPILGLLVGTANIATKTITLNDFQSFHVKRGFISNGAPRDMLNSAADNGKIFDAVQDRICNEPQAIMAALLKEIIHLRSDINTISSLPLPIISIYDDKLAKTLCNYGIDMANVMTVGKQIAGAVAIDFIVSGIHYLMKEENVPQHLYEVRTRKIITFSNLLATYSNVLATTLIAPYFGKNLNSKIDLGGYVYTFCNAISNIDFIYKIKEEFIFNNYINLINEV